MLSLDGSYGEGGGQVLRTALSLAALTGVPVRIEGIRAKRSKPGLRPQHLTAVQAVARVSQGEVTGARLGSQALTFKPRTPQGGHYCFDVAETTGSAGAVTLVAQALLPPLLQGRISRHRHPQRGHPRPLESPGPLPQPRLSAGPGRHGGGGGDDPGALGLVSPGRRRGAPQHWGVPAA